MNDLELMELCKEVYKRTGWTDTLQCVWNGRISMPEQSVIDYGIESKYSGYHPLYTSDYLLEKLAFKEPFVGYTLSDGWIAYTKDFNVREGGLFVGSTSPTLALLKLTIALDDAGELSHV